MIFLNENVVYIDYLDSYLDIGKEYIPKFIRKILYRVLNFIGFIKQNKNLLQITWVENDGINQKMMNNLIEKIKKLHVKDIVLAESLANKKEITNVIENAGYNILDGKWLYKFLAYDITRKIAYIKNKNIADMEITILSNKDSDINFGIIKALAKECKILNVVTDQMDTFKALENTLFEDYGINITVSRNKKKACLHSDVILNFDFENKLLKLCKFKKKSIVVQFTKEKFENREGITIVFFKLNIPIKYFNNIEYKGHFEEEILYESFLYYKTSFRNVRKIFKKDNIQIKYFVGNNGKIAFNEFRN